ncbi:MAG: lysine--tRNA ligase, partial [Bdellovibrionota bacterium]
MIIENPLRAEKRKKLNDLRDKGIDPYPHNFDRNGHAGDIVRKYDQSLEVGQVKEDAVYRVAGRLMTKR